MSVSAAEYPHPSEIGAPAWPVALLFSFQGAWTEDDYLSLQARTSQIVELSDGRIEVPSMASPLHQRIVRFLFRLLEAAVAAAGAGEAFFAPLPVRLGPGKYHEPDIAFFKPGRIADPRRQPQGADLVIEVVSAEEEDRQRDYVTKRKEYALAGITEYWIVDPQTETIHVLVLDASEYRLLGEFTSGMTAASKLLPSFVVDVKSVFDAGRGAESK